SQTLPAPQSLLFLHATQSPATQKGADAPHWLSAVQSTQPSVRSHFLFVGHPAQGPPLPGFVPPHAITTAPTPSKPPTNVRKRIMECPPSGKLYPRGRPNRQIESIHVVACA